MNIILRIDDAGQDEPPLAALVGRLVSGGFPIALQVVPGWLSATFIDEMRRLADQHGPLIELGQHGWTHRNQAPAGERAYEFGPSRSRSAQVDDLRRGGDRLKEAFPRHDLSVFSPPHDRLDQTTLDVLVELDFRIVTGGPLTFSGLSVPGTLQTMPCDVDASHWVAGRRRLRDVAGLCDDIRRRKGPVVGVALHAREIPDAVELARLVRGFADLRDEGFAFRTFRQPAG